MADDQPPDDDEIKYLDGDDEPGGTSSRVPIPSWAPWSIFVLGVAGAAAHAFWSEKFEFHLDLDVITIGWLGVAIAGLLLPNLASLELGDVKLKLTKERAAAVAQRSVDQTAGLLLQWATSTSILLDMICADTDSDVSDARAMTFIRDRMNDARPFLSQKLNDNVRIALWLYEPDADVLVYSDVTVGGPKPTKLSYATDEGMLGRTFAENFFDSRFYNEADCRKSPSYLGTRDGYDPPYRAVMGVPIRSNNAPIGMLAMDKISVGKFTLAAEQVARALAAVCSTAFIAAQQQRTMLDSSVEAEIRSS